MSRKNQNSKWKAHQQADPIISETTKKSEPLVLVEVQVNAPVQPEEETKPLVKKGKKDSE